MIIIVTQTTALFHWPLYRCSCRSSFCRPFFRHLLYRWICFTCTYGFDRRQIGRRSSPWIFRENTQQESSKEPSVLGRCSAVSITSGWFWELQQVSHGQNPRCHVYRTRLPSTTSHKPAYQRWLDAATSWRERRSFVDLCCWRMYSGDFLGKRLLLTSQRLDIAVEIS